MKIVLFHPTQLPPRDYGGVERVVLWLAKGLAELGHDVSVGALAGSILPKGVTLIETDPSDPSATGFLKRLPKGTEVVHFMAPPEEAVWASLPCAGVVTIHGNGKPGEIFPKNTVFLSQDHARRHAGAVHVYNGIDPGEYVFEPKLKKSAYLFMARTVWSVKNLRGAIRLCGRAGVPLWVAGGHRPFGPRLRLMLRPGSRWCGPVGGHSKALLLAQAKALIFPVLWPEPFGLAVVEALVSGTPVLASRIGSLPELVPSNVGRLFGPGDEEWIEWLRRESLPFEPERCRTWVLDHFHYRKMAEGYEQVYRRIVAGDVLNKEHPRTLSTEAR